MRNGSSAGGAVPTICPVDDYISSLSEHPAAPDSIREGPGCRGALLEDEQLGNSATTALPRVDHCNHGLLGLPMFSDGVKPEV